VAALFVLVACQSTSFAQAVGGSITPKEVGRMTAARMDEISGLAVSRQNPEILWMHNDGSLKEIFAVATNGKLVARVRIPTAINDVEDIAIGPGPESGVDFVYLGDIGDNDDKRREVRLIRFREPTLTQPVEKEFSAEGVEAIRLLYPDGPHNAEALFIEQQTGDIYIVTKEKTRARLYRAAANKLSGNLPVALEFVAQLNVADVSAGDMSRAGDLVILRRENQGWIWSRRPSESLASALRRPPRPIVVLSDGQSANGESVGFSPDGRSYYTVSEGKRQPIAVFPVPARVLLTTPSG
jgi:hypothetical protein